MSDAPRTQLPIETPRVSTGIAGLDEILGGGLPAGHMYLIEGESGAGKTTVGMQFLLDGVRRGERTLWISLSEEAPDLARIAASHGWSFDGVVVSNPSSPAKDLDPEQQYSFFSPSDVELDDMRGAVVAAVEQVRPHRVVFDPFSDVRHLSRDVLKYRRQVLLLRALFAAHGCTALLMQEMSRDTPGDVQAEALVHGYLTLHQDSPDFGGQRRRVRVHKMRGIPFRGGYHDFTIETGGVQVYPRLVAADHFEPLGEESISSGVKPLDDLLGGGVPRGSNLLVLGPAGVGKSVLMTQYAVAAAERGERVSLFIFDETARTFASRSASLGLAIDGHIRSGMIVLKQVDSAEFSAGRFTHTVMREVDEFNSQLIVIDSLSGYLNSMPEERFLATHLHELLTYLNHRNVVTLLTLAQHGFMGERVTSPLDISYLADTVLMLAYFEAFGAVRRAISVAKKRSGAHEVYVREMTVAEHGVRLGEPLVEFHGVLTGHPQYSGTHGDLDRKA